MSLNLSDIKHSKLIIGLTGGIGSGKTAVSDLFASLGIQVVDADVLARQALELGSPLLVKVFNHFGEGLKLEDGSLDRAKLREIVFNSSADKAWLENLVHPWVKQASSKALAKATSPYVLLSSPLLIESGQLKLTNRLLVVDVPESIQIERTSARDANSPDLVKKIIAQQISRKDRLSQADDLIDNAGDLNNLEKQVNSLHSKYLKLALTKSKSL